MDLSEIKIDQLDLSVRAYNGLSRAGFCSAESLIQLSEDDLIRIQNLGKKTVEEIWNIIQQLRNGNTQSVLLEKDSSKTELESLGFSVRLTGVLTRMGLSNISEIVSLSDEQLMSQKNIGKTSLQEFRRWRTQYLLSNPALVQPKTVNEEPVQLDAGKLKRTILAIYRDAGFCGYSLDEIRTQADPEGQINLAEIKKAIGQLLAEKELEYVDFRCYRTYPSFREYLKEVPKIDDRNRTIVTRLLNGETLEAVGADYGLTRERVRQCRNAVIQKAEKNKQSYTGNTLFDEDYYRYFYETYLPDESAYVNWLGISAETWNYLEMRYKRGNNNLEDALGDSNLDIPLRLKIQSYLNRDKVLIDNVLVKKSRADLEVAVLRKYCTEKTSLNDFRSKYNRFLQELNITDEKLHITDDTIRSRQNKLAESHFVLWNYFSSFRYYDIDSHDYTKLLDTLGLEAYENIELSTLKFWDENPELMVEYDIRDHYELHNLLKKIVPARSYHDFHTSKRMPIIQFGKPDMESRLLELLINNTPIEINAFADLVRQEFGYEQASFIASPEMNALKIYYHNGILNIEQKVMSLENQKRLRQALTEDFYFMDELKQIYAKAVTEADLDEINPYNLKVLGFIVLSRYAVRNHSSLDAYLRKLLLQNEITDLTVLRKRYGYVILFSQILMELKRSYEVIEFEPNQIVAFRRLAHMGVTKEMLRSFCDQAHNYFPPGQYFTAHYLKTQGFQSELYDLGFDDWFYAQVLASDSRFANTQAFGNIVLCSNTKQITIQSFLVSMIQEYGSVDVLDLISDMESDYGFSGLVPSDIVYRAKNAGIFYDDVLHQLYADKEQYYWELDNQEALG